MAKEGTDISFLEFDKGLSDKSSKEIQLTGIKVPANLGSVTQLEDIKRELPVLQEHLDTLIYW